MLMLRGWKLASTLCVDVVYDAARSGPFPISAWADRNGFMFKGCNGSVDVRESPSLAFDGGFGAATGGNESREEGAMVIV